MVLKRWRKRKDVEYLLSVPRPYPWAWEILYTVDYEGQHHNGILSFKEKPENNSEILTRLDNKIDSIKNPPKEIEMPELMMDNIKE